jgi:hypothetical protein
MSLQTANFRTGNLAYLVYFCHRSVCQPASLLPASLSLANLSSVRLLSLPGPESVPRPQLRLKMSLSFRLVGAKDRGEHFKVYSYRIRAFIIKSAGILCINSLKSSIKLVKHRNYCN